MSMDSDERCVGCGSQEVENVSGPDEVHGSGDHSRYDGVTLVWLLPTDRIPPPGGLCDDCVDRHVEAGALEAIHSGFQGGLPDGRPSETVYALMFQRGAAAARQAFVQATRDRPAPEWPHDDDAAARILKMRQSIAPHEPNRAYADFEREEYLELAQRVGQMHAIAACALGHADTDPSFEAAARAWAAERVAKDAEDAQLRVEGEALYASMFADMGGEGTVDELLAELERAERANSTPS